MAWREAGLDWWEASAIATGWGIRNGWWEGRRGEETGGLEEEGGGVVPEDAVQQSHAGEEQPWEGKQPGGGQRTRGETAESLN